MVRSKMKLKQVTTALFLAFALGTHAQVGELRNNFAIGVNGGYALNKVAFNPTIKLNYHQGMTLGITARYTCEKYFSSYCALQAEVNYTQLGWNELIETSTDTYDRTINYIQVPLLARLGWGKEHRGLMGYLILGPQIGFFLNEKEKRGTSDGTAGWTEATLNKRPNHITAQYDLPVQNSFEYGITGGAGIELSSAIGHFLLEGRYYYGLADLFHNGKKDKFGKSSNGTILAKVSYLLDVKKRKKSAR